MRRATSLAAGREAADDLLSSLLGVRVQKAIDPLTPDGFVLIGKTVSQKLVGVVQGQEKSAVAEVLRTLDFDWKRASPEAATAAMNAINESIFKSYTKKVLPKISDVFVIEGPKVMKGTKASVIAREKIDISAKLKQRDRDAEKTIRDSHVNFIRTSTGERIEKASKQARKLVSNALAEGVGNAVIAQDLRKHFADSVPRPVSYWRTVADSYVGRARTTSQIYSYEEASIVSFEVVAVLDEVTTDQCRFMDGRVFSVKSARTMLDSLNDLDNPEDVKFANPWIRKGRDENGAMRLYVTSSSGAKTSLATIDRSGMGKQDDRGAYSNAKSNAELSLLGVPCPPFHGRCRTSVVASTEEVETSSAPVMIPGADLESPAPPTAPDIPDALAIAPEDVTREKILEVVAKLPSESSTMKIVPVNRFDLHEAAKATKKTLTEDEENALARWTGFSYGRIRDCDAGKPTPSKSIVEATKALQNLLVEKEHVPVGNVFRGFTAPPKFAHELLTGKTMTFDSMSSWTSSRTIGEKFADGEMGTGQGRIEDRVRVLVTIEKSRGIPIGGHEEELLVAKEKYRIVSRAVDEGGRLRVHLEVDDVTDEKPKTKKADEEAVDELAPLYPGQAKSFDEIDFDRFGSDGSDVTIGFDTDDTNDSEA